MRSVMNRQAWIVALMLLAGMLAGCTLLEPSRAETEQREKMAAAEQSRKARLNTRPPVNTNRNLYEGSLWRGAASWGNLLRDHRARYRGDLLTINEMQRIIKVPEAPRETLNQPDQAAPEEGQNQALLDPVLAFLKEQENRRAEVDREQNDILRSIDSIEMEVVRVLANGNMQVRGVHPPIFRDRNRVKYIVTLKGIVRPSDVGDDNSISAAKLSKAEYRISRFVKRQAPPITAALRATGRRRTASTLDRFTDLVTAPGGGNRTTRGSSR